MQYDVQFFNQGNMYAITVFSKFTIIEAVHHVREHVNNDACTVYYSNARDSNCISRHSVAY